MYISLLDNLIKKGVLPMEDRFIDLSKYEIREIIQNEDNNFDEIIHHLLSILNDISIPENQKQLVRKQFNEIMKIKNITMQPPTFILSPKNNF
jgi:hypothetical protein